MNRLIVFTRYPEPGKVKTRLIPALGNDGAAELQRLMIEHTLKTTRGLRNTDVEVRYEGGSRAAMQAWLGNDLSCREQGPGDLGTRMASAFRDSIDSGFKRTVTIGTDCPGITVPIIDNAFSNLQDNDLVLSPAKDGGYHLVGLTSMVPELFVGIDWGTDQVLEKTLAVAGQEKLRVMQLEELHDVDRPEDLAILRATPEIGFLIPEAGGERHSELISVIIPTLNEEAYIASTLEHAFAGDNVEVIVADAGSRDGTVAIARKAGATVMEKSGGRAAQLNEGARACSGSILLFLHADTLLPDGYDAEVRRLLKKRRTVLGAFRFRTDGCGPAIRLIEMGTNLRSRVFGRPYGDQGLFLTEESFKAIGGFPDIAIMEDFELVRRACKQGRVVTTSLTVTTSARRWQQRGVLQTMFINQLVIAGYYLGVPPEKLSSFYRGRKGTVS